MITFNHMFNNKLIMWLDLIIWLSKFNAVLVLTTSLTTDPRLLWMLVKMDIWKYIFYLTSNKRPVHYC